MKPMILILGLLLANNITSIAQCGKKTILSSTETFYLDSSGTVKKTVNEKSVVQISPSEVIINVNDEHKMTGIVKSTTCNWTVPFKQGKTQLKTVIGKDGETKNVTIDIEGKEGKITLLFKMDDRPGEIIKVVTDKFEEEKG